MKTFELTLRGFDIETTATDDLIFWVKAPSREILMQHLKEAPLPLAEPPRHLVGRDVQIDASEVDFVLDGAGNRISVLKDAWAHPQPGLLAVTDWTAEQMAAIQFHEDWSDGRVGFLWCRFDAIVDRIRALRAEITWSDDYTKSQRSNDSDIRYFHPQLRLEKNRIIGSEWVTQSFITLSLTRGEVHQILAKAPSALLQRYADKYARLEDKAAHVEVKAEHVVDVSEADRA